MWSLIVYPRYLGLAERLWDGGTPPDAKRPLDLTLYAAAQLHCDMNGKGPLQS